MKREREQPGKGGALTERKSIDRRWPFRCRAVYGPATVTRGRDTSPPTVAALISPPRAAGGNYFLVSFVQKPADFPLGSMSTVA